MKLKAGDKVFLLGCSNGMTSNDANKQELVDLVTLLEVNFQLVVEVAPTIFVSETTKQTHSAKERAKYLVDALTDTSVQAVFDLTGGDLSNEVLTAISPDQWQAIAQVKDIAYIAYSDNTVILNALVSQSRITAINFLLWMVVRDDSGTAYRGFEQVIMAGQRDDWQKIKLQDGSPVSSLEPSEIIGGNIRCFLKLAGTKFMPQADHKGLLLEAHSGNLTKMRTYIAQLDLIGVLEAIDFIVLGKFSELEATGEREAFDRLILEYANQQGFEVCVTDYVGHHAATYPFQMTR